MAKVDLLEQIERSFEGPTGDTQQWLAGLTENRNELDEETRLRLYRSQVQAQPFQVAMSSDIVGQFEAPPDDVLEAFNDVFSYCGAGTPDSDVFLGYHPWLRRWCMFEKYTKKGTELYWSLVTIFHDDMTVEEDYIPTDYRDDEKMHHYAGLIGEYKMPSRRDFAELVRFDTRRNGVKAVMKAYHDDKEARKREQDCIIEAFTHDFFTYHERLYMHEANQKAGCMQKTWCVQTDYVDQLRTDPRFYLIEKRPGYTVRRKRTKEEWEQALKESDEVIALVKELVAKEAASKSLKQVQDSHALLRQIIGETEKQQQSEEVVEEILVNGSHQTA